MVTPTLRQRLAQPRPGLDILLTTLFTAAAAAGLLYVEASGEPAGLGPLRYAAILPVALAAYRPRGLLSGQVMAGFFSSIFLWQLAWDWIAGESAPVVAEPAAAALLLHLVAYAVASASASVRGREALANAARGWEGLLARATSLEDAASFILEEAGPLTGARQAALLLRNPMDASWELVAVGESTDLTGLRNLSGLRSMGERVPLLTDAGTGEGLTLAGWLVGQAAPQLIDDLDADPRFETRSLGPAVGPRSLLAQPLAAPAGASGPIARPDRSGGGESERPDRSARPVRSGGGESERPDRSARPVRSGGGEIADDGQPLGVLVLLDRRNRPFGHSDLDRLAPLVAAGSQALAQAGLLARTDQALARRAAQLAAIQRAARDLNAILDAGSIVRRALACLTEIVPADAALVMVSADGLPLAWRAQGASLDDSAAAALAAAARSLRHSTLEPPAGLALAGSARPGQRQLAAPLRRGAEMLGVMLAESRRKAAFDGQDLLAVAALADHTAIALENARLFAQARAERERADSIIRNMADGLLTLDHEGRVAYLNPAAERLTGWRVAGAAGRPVCEVLGCAAEGSERGTDEPGAAGCGRSCGLMVALASGQEFYRPRWPARPRATGPKIFGLSAAPLPGPEHAAVVLIRDATAEEELARFQRELVATFSHELRAPLANIEALAAALLREDAGEAEMGAAPLPRQHREYLEMLRGQSRRLSALAERTLDVARLDEGAWRLEPRPLALGRLLADAAARWQPVAGGRALRLPAAGARQWAVADEEAAGVVLDNLIDNALKYSPPGTEIVLDLAEGPAGFVTVAVEDHGPGIPDGLRERLFDRFVRGEMGDGRRTYGVGLGLYVAQRLVAAMGGRIWAEDAAGGGSRFAFTLPALKEARHQDLDR